MANEIVRVLRRIGACEHSRDWAGGLPEGTTLQQAWDLCPRADWLLWVLSKAGAKAEVNWKSVVLAACACARTSLRFVPEGEERPRLAIETAERWARGEATGIEVRAAYRASYAAAACAARAASCAAYAAACAALAAAAYADADDSAAGADSADADSATFYAYSSAADSATYSARAAAHAATYAASDAAWSEARRGMAHSVRGFFPHPPVVDFT